MRHRAIAKGIDLHVEIESQGAVSGDALRIRQIASNLIGNAIKFTAAGHVAVHLHVGPVEDDDQRAIQLSVADTGPGVSPQQQALIFQRFQQATEGTARQFGGSGLGLAIVKELVEHMHGELSLQSQVGGGSTFAVRLRLPATTLQPSAAPNTAGPGVERVMLVEDDRINREVLRALLVRLSCEVTVAEDGEEAVARWAAAAPVQRPQLIFMDCQMPGLDGFDATRQLRALGCAPCS